MRLTPFHFTVMLCLSALFHGGLGYLSLPGDGADPEEPLVIHLGEIEKLSKKIAAPQKLEDQEKRVDRPKHLVKQQPVLQEPAPPKKLHTQPALKEIPATPPPAPTQPPVNAPQIDPVAQASYEQVLADWLERHKHYPRRALKRGTEGELLLYVKISKQGAVLRSEITRSSGHAVLDEEVALMVKRADPFPEIPEEFNVDTFQFVVPVVFAINS